MPAAEPNQLVTVMVGLFALMGFVYLALGIVSQVKKLSGKMQEDEFTAGKQLSSVSLDVRILIKELGDKLDRHAESDLKEHREVRDLLGVISRDVAVLKALLRRRLEDEEEDTKE